MTEIDEGTLRDQLKAKRNSLQKEFHMNPSKTRLALEIRLIDDLIASLAKYLQMQRTPKAEGRSDIRLGSTYTDWNDAIRQSTQSMRQFSAGPAEESRITSFATKRPSKKT